MDKKFVSEYEQKYTSQLEQEITHFHPGDYAKYTFADGDKASLEEIKACSTIFLRSAFKVVLKGVPPHHIYIGITSPDELNARTSRHFKKNDEGQIDLDAHFPVVCIDTEHVSIAKDIEEEQGDWNYFLRDKKFWNRLPGHQDPGRGRGAGDNSTIVYIGVLSPFYRDKADKIIESQKAEFEAKLAYIHRLNNFKYSDNK